MSAELHIEKHLNQTLVNKQSVSTGLFDAYKVILDNARHVFIKYQSSAKQNGYLNIFGLVATTLM